jgi:polysaccharide export outer membrane protein
MKHSLQARKKSYSSYKFIGRGVLDSTHSLNPGVLGMSRRNRTLILRSVWLFVAMSFGLQLLAQTPVSGVAQQPATSDSQTAATQSHGFLPNSNAKLGVGDLIEVVVFGVPDLSTKTRISGSGDIYLPLIDYVHVADLSTDEAQGLIQKRLEDGGFVRNPHVLISVDESISQTVTVMGEVSRPGPYPATGERHLFDMISAAGGLTDKAGRNVTIEHRENPGERVDLQLSSNLADDSKNNVDVFPGDTIIVSRAGIIYVVGDVSHPSGFMIEDTNLSVLKALALAGGSTRTSDLKKTKILRQTPNGIQEIPINLKKVLYNQAPDVALMKGDVLFVPGSAAKAAAYRTGEAAMSFSTALAVIAVHP